MAPWGVGGGGPKNDQSLADLVTYIESIQLTPAQSQKAEVDALVAARSNDPKTVCPEYMTCPGIELAAAKETLATAKKDLETKRTAVRHALSSPAATDAGLN